MARTQAATQKTNFDIGVRKLQQIRCKTFQRKKYFT